ncbi:MAG TPA: hypothetical protein VGG70_12125, partial [Candidatus Cybelea sp.]
GLVPLGGLAPAAKAAGIIGFAQATPTPTPTPADEGQTLTIPRGIIVPVRVTKEVRVGGLGTSQQEHKLKFAVDEDVIVQGYIIAKTGDLVEGHYDTQTNVTKRFFSSNTSQEVELDIDDLVNFCGDTIHLEFERTFVGGARGGFMSFGYHAHDAVFGKDSILKASTDRVEKHICVDTSSESPPPLPKNIIAPDDGASPSPF